MTVKYPPVPDMGWIYAGIVEGGMPFPLVQDLDGLVVCSVVDDGIGADKQEDRCHLIAAAPALLKALALLLPPMSRGDERIGWRGTSTLDPTSIYACEFCNAENLDPNETQHADDCPVTIGRNAIASAIPKSRWRAD